MNALHEKFKDWRDERIATVDGTGCAQPKTTTLTFTEEIARQGTNKFVLSNHIRHPEKTYAITNVRVKLDPVNNPRVTLTMGGTDIEKIGNADHCLLYGDVANGMFTFRATKGILIPVLYNEVNGHKIELVVSAKQVPFSFTYEVSYVEIDPIPNNKMLETVFSRVVNNIVHDTSVSLQNTALRINITGVVKKVMVYTDKPVEYMVLMSEPEDIAYFTTLKLSNNIYQYECVFAPTINFSAVGNTYLRITGRDDTNIDVYSEQLDILQYQNGMYGRAFSV